MVGMVKILSTFVCFQCRSDGEERRKVHSVRDIDPESSEEPCLQPNRRTCPHLRTKLPAPPKKQGVNNHHPSPPYTSRDTDCSMEGRCSPASEGLASFAKIVEWTRRGRERRCTRPPPQQRQPRPPPRPSRGASSPRPPLPSAGPLPPRPPTAPFRTPPPSRLWSGWSVGRSVGAFVRSLVPSIHPSMQSIVSVRDCVQGGCTVDKQVDSFVSRKRARCLREPRSLLGRGAIEAFRGLGGGKRGFSGTLMGVHRAVCSTARVSVDLIQRYIKQHDQQQLCCRWVMHRLRDVFHTTKKTG